MTSPPLPMPFPLISQSDLLWEFRSYQSVRQAQASQGENSYSPQGTVLGSAPVSTSGLSGGWEILPTRFRIKGFVGT